MQALDYPIAFNARECWNHMSNIFDLSEELRDFHGDISQLIMDQYPRDVNCMRLFDRKMKIADEHWNKYKWEIENAVA